MTFIVINSQQNTGDSCV